MPRKTKLIIAEGFQVVDIGHRRQFDEDIVDDIGHRRSVEDIGHRRKADDIGHHRPLDAGLLPDIGHLRTVFDLNEPHMVRRITVQQGADGHIHLELEE